MLDETSPRFPTRQPSRSVAPLPACTCLELGAVYARIEPRYERRAVPARTIHHADGVAWLRETELDAASSIVTSLPDWTELRELGFDGWKSWFVETAELACRRVADEAVAIFYQSDVKHDACWVDKGFLVTLGAERAGSAMLWHKIVCRAAPGTASRGRPGYAHILCFSRSLRLAPSQPSPDVLPELGRMLWSRAMGLDACRTIATFLAEQTSCRTVVDPFCGIGTMLAVANAHGLDAIGVERARRRVQRARRLVLERRDPAPMDADSTKT